MPQISFRCISCNAKLNAPQTRAGDRIECPRCQQPLEIPGGESAGAHSPPPVPAFAESVAEPAPRSDEFDEEFLQAVEGEPDEFPRSAGRRVNLHASTIQQERKQRRDKVRWAVEILDVWIRVMVILGGIVLTGFVGVMLVIVWKSDFALYPLMLLIAGTALGIANLFLTWAGSYLTVGAVALIADMHEVATANQGSVFG